MPIVQGKNTKIFLGVMEVTSYQIGVDMAAGESESVGVWQWYDSAPKQMEFTVNLDFSSDIWPFYEMLFERPFYRWPKWVMQAVLLVSFIILVMVLA